MLSDASLCKYGCAINERCGSETECDMAAIGLIVGLSIFGGVCVICCCCSCCAFCKNVRFGGKQSN